MASPGSLVDKIDALRRFVEVVDGYVPEQRLATVRAVASRAGERLSLSREHTVVALAGATGSGKSSIFNALAGLDASPVGLRRPTTGAAHACVWEPDGAGELLDWLDVAPSRRFDQETALNSDDEKALRGLVLLDLPDLDSVDSSHRIEVDRLLTLVDLVVWVLDPQKYADRLVHRQYLEQFRRHRDVTVVLLNQADILGPADTEQCLADLVRLLDADGLAGVPTLATSTIGPPGLGPLREILERTVAARLAALRRLAADVDTVVVDLAPLVEVEPPQWALADDAVESGVVRALTDALSHAAGVPVVAVATQKAYRHRAIRAMGWPVARWLRRLRPDPLSRLRLGGRTVDGRAEPGAAADGAVASEVAPVGATSVPPAAPVAQAAVGLALRTLAERAGGALPAPWPAAVLAAARSRRDDLADALDMAIARTDLGLSRRRQWWRVVGALQWLAALVTLVGLLWLAVRFGLLALGLPELLPAPRAGRMPLPTLLFLGGLLAGLLVSVIVRPLIGLAARRARARATRRMRAAVRDVATEMVITPVRRVLHAYRDARAALWAVGDGQPSH
jgi:energy-coupling factor transporter ATP-binding protein EcfA2